MHHARSKGGEGVVAAPSLPGFAPQGFAQLCTVLACKPTQGVECVVPLV